ncbi:Vesicle transport protein GOT1 isoform A [Glycine soja]|uniref:Vesicle transport protein GOT1 isoform A n=1 Tax=Glycine soja TaxID=3848 RepID=A0A445F0I1_GLYSO|nr:Vesicle transport protein GOT1 isoform A [Glycine soja]
MVSFEMNDRKKIGLGLTGFGIFFSFLGLIFFFDKGLLAMGNILFVSGVSLTIGLKSTMQFFMKRSNFKGTISFGIGFFILILGWPILGMIVESYGFIVLFSGFWPTLAVFLQKIPVLGWLFQQPFVRSVSSCAEMSCPYNLKHLYTPFIKAIYFIILHSCLCYHINRGCSWRS